jgi:hypothetical protein
MVKNVGLSSHRNDFRFGNLKITDESAKAYAPRGQADVLGGR